MHVGDHDGFVEVGFPVSLLEQLALALILRNGSLKVVGLMINLPVNSLKLSQLLFLRQSLRRQV